MIRLEWSLVIHRPPEVVFAFRDDFTQYPKWTGVSEVSKTSSGPMGVGTTFREVRTFLGRRIESEFEVIEYAPPHTYASRSRTGPFPLEVHWSFAPVADGTQVTVISEAAPGGFFQLAEPLIARFAQRQSQTILENLKALIEGEGGDPTAAGAR
jgi:uncharacterized protein YndB with AHSA1/START domain